MSPRHLSPRVCAATLALSAALLTLGSAPDAQAKDIKEVVTTSKLANGLEVIVIEDHTVPLVTIEIAVKNGAFTEPAELNGLSHLYEHMFFKGNAVIPTQEAYLARMRELGMVFNGTTSDERVNYYFTMPAANLEQGMVFMRDAITTPKFDEAEFQKEIQVVIGEVDRNESNPYYWLSQAISQRMWHAHPTRKDALGDRATITSATVEKMKVMQQRYYVPNNAALLIAGDVDPAQATKLAQALFKDWKPSPKDPHVTYPVPQHPPLNGHSTVLVEQRVRVPFMQLGWHGPSVTADPKATYAADVLSYILAQPTSKFYKALVDSGVTLGAGLSYYTQKYTGPINVSAQVRPDKLKDALKATLIELQRLADPDYFSDAQLESAKQILRVQAIYDQEKASALVHTVSFWWSSAGLDYYFNYVPSLEAVTRQDIARFVQDYVLNKPFVLGVLLSQEQAKSLGLDQAALDALLKETLNELKIPLIAAAPTTAPAKSPTPKKKK